MNDYTQKFERIHPQTPFSRLAVESRRFVQEKALRHRFTLQELKQVCDIARDLELWNEAPIQQVWPADTGPSREDKRRILAALTAHWQRLRETPNSYAGFHKAPPRAEQRIVFGERRKGALGLGDCPVASPRTRCCNLMTLDAVENCGFDCSYCSIQSFYHGDRVNFDPGFAEKLAALELDPKRIYHIGTGQSSDSLMWGNRGGVLDALLAFARAHPNVILEFKTKSKNVAHLLRNELPPNLILTWSLNTPTLIDHEEHLTASLEERLTAAQRVAEKGALVGFHLHPMIHYDRWEAEYAALFEALLARFDPRQVALVSLGTLTFIKPVMKRIRERDFRSKILQMPLVETAGKWSYPEAVKLDLFRHAYAGLTPWHEEVFFYLCMEPATLWPRVFGFDYPDNAAFEAAMKAHYMEKIEALRKY